MNACHDQRIVRRLLCVGTVVLAALASALVIAGTLYSASASTPPHVPSQRLADQGASSPGANYPNCRFGVGGNVGGYDVAELNVGWHLNFGAQLNPPRPNGAEYVQIVRLSPDSGGYVYTPTAATLVSIMDQNPGATWLIGNEPDSPWQDNLVPETLARAYHDLYYLIKQHDPSAQVGIGAIVQPTPLRLQYLDRVWNAYQEYYGQKLPTDLWNTHSYILREIDPSDPEAKANGGPYGVWGAYIPPGLSATRGILYNESDMFSVAIFGQRLLDFRTWMSNHGERDKPLYITEYGELFPYPPYESEPYVDENGVPITEARVMMFMTSTFDLLRSATDPVVGYAADGNRLVQRWVWYSVADSSFGGLLFDPSSRQRRPLGDVFYTYTHSISPSVDLLAVRVEADPAAISDTGQLQTTTLKAMVSNIGNISIMQPISVAFYAGQSPSGTLIGSMQVLPSGLKGCAAKTEVSVTWPNLDTGAHPMYVQVDPGGTLNEANRANNLATGVALVATEYIYLPLITRTSSSQ